MTAAEFIRPFLNTQFISEQKNHEIKQVIKSLKNEKSLNDFSLNTVDIEECQAPDMMSINKRIHEIVQQNQPNIDNFKQTEFRTKKDVKEHLKQNQTKWFDKSLETFYEMNRYNFEQSFIDQPFAIIYMIDYKDSLQQLSQLQQENYKQLQRIFQHNYQDHINIPRCNLVLYDNEEDIQIAFQLQNSLQQQYSSSFNRIFAINSMDSENRNFWNNQKFKQCLYYQNLPSQKQEIALSNADINSLFEISDEIIKSTISSIEIRLQMMEQNLSINKKGFRNVMKNFFRQKEKIIDQNSYQLNTQEVYHLLIAEILMIIQDYEESYNYLKWLLYELKDKSYKHYANVLELISICQVFMMNQQTFIKVDENQLFDNLRTSFEIYRKQQNLQKYQVRVIINYILFQNIFNKFDKITVKILFEEFKYIKQQLQELTPIVQAIILEQYSIMLLKMKPIQYRRYCMHLLYSGHKYANFKLNTHAIRCYLVANTLYEQANWKDILDYVYNRLAHNYRQLQKYDDSLVFYKKVLNLCNSKDNVQKHEKIINDFQQMINEFNQYAQQSISLIDENEKNIENINKNKYDLQLPKINKRQIDVLLQTDSIIVHNQPEQYNYIEVQQNEQFHQVDNKWFQMYQDIQQKLLDNRPFKDCQNEQKLVQLYDCKNLQQKNKLFIKNQRVSYVNHNIILQFFISNPLKVNLNIHNILPIYQFQSKNNQENQQNTQIECQPFNIILNPLQNNYLVQLKIQPLQEGKLSIQGVQWLMFGLQCELQFDFSQTQKNIIQIQQQQGFLDIKINGFDNNMYINQIKPIQFSFKNNNPTNKIKQILLQSSTDNLLFTQLPGCIEPEQEIKQNYFIRGSCDKNTRNLQLLIKIIDQHDIHYLQRIIIPLNIQKSFCINNIQTYTLLSDLMVNFQVEDQIADQQSMLDYDPKYYQVVFNKVILLNNRYKFQNNSQLKQLQKHDNINFKLIENDTQNISTIQDKLYDKDFCIDSTQNKDNSLYNHIEVIEKYLTINQNKKGNNNQEQCLLIFWSFKDQNDQMIEGIQDNIGFNINTYKQIDVNKQFPLQIELQSKQNEVEYNFNENKYYELDVNLVIKNVNYSDPISFKIEISNQEVQEYYIQGKTSMNIKDLKNNQIYEQKIKFIFLQRGFYNLCQYKVTFYVKKNSQKIVHPIHNYFDQNLQDIFTIHYTSKQLDQVKYFTIK